ncbi:hypothetical protein C8R45DRAFT_961236 [Mycena sanguinolenta]|nr:hypothetical protein C8R45DRAFT_961236 [Mycena sanguinolenta]
MFPFNTASSDIATHAVMQGARLITHLFNAVPQLHLRDLSISGLLGASPHVSGPTSADVFSTSHVGHQLQAFDYRRVGSRSELHLDKGQLAYSAFPDGCILITDAMKILDPNLRAGTHDSEWRDGKRFVKEYYKLYLEGTRMDTLGGSVVTLESCVRNFSGCSLGEAIKCATFNPAKYLRIENTKGTLRPGADADLIVLKCRSHLGQGSRVWGSAA